MQPLKETLKTVLKNIEAASLVSEKDRINTALASVLSEKELKNIEIRSLYKGALEIFCASSAWLYQINLKKQKILECLQKETKDIKINKIYLKLKNE
jgi:hypothetical protein